MADERFAEPAGVSALGGAFGAAGPFDDLADSAAVFGGDASGGLHVGVGAVGGGGPRFGADAGHRCDDAGSQRSDAEHRPARHGRGLHGVPEAFGEGFGPRADVPGMPANRSPVLRVDGDPPSRSPAFGARRQRRPEHEEHRHPRRRRPGPRLASLPSCCLLTGRAVASAPCLRVPCGSWTSRACRRGCRPPGPLPVRDGSRAPSQVSSTAFGSRRRRYVCTGRRGAP